MKGNNAHQLCQAEMVAIVQFYFDNKLFREGESPTVEEVRGSGDYCFTVKTSDHPKPAQSGSNGVRDKAQPAYA